MRLFVENINVIKKVILRLLYILFYTCHAE